MFWEKAAHSDVLFVFLGGDFNCGNIEWSSMQVPRGYRTGVYRVKFWKLYKSNACPK